MAFAFKFHRRSVCKAVVWLVVVALGISTLLLHNKGMMVSTDYFSSSFTSRKNMEDATFAMPVVRQHKNASNNASTSSSSTNKSKVTTSRKVTKADQKDVIRNSQVVTPATAAKTKTSEASKVTPPSFTTNVASSIRERCFPYNSDRWIQGEKETTLIGGSLSPQEMEILMEGPRHFDKLHALFQETICHDQSPLKQVTPSQAVDAPPSLSFLQRTEEWYQRFFYLAMHWKFHSPALREYQARKECQQSEQYNSFMKENRIGDLDFECPDAKFVVSAIGHIGFGAFINTQVCMTILIALRTGRIPIFTSQSLYWWQRGKTDPWLLAPTHCDQKNLQCYYMPMTPCALLIEDVRNATKYGSDKEEQRWLRENMNVPEEFKNERIVAINSGLQSKGQETEEIRTIMANVVGELMEEWKKQHAANPSVPLWSENDWKAMELAKQWMVDKTKEDPFGLLRQMYVYFLRFNPHYKQVLKDRMTGLIPPTMVPSDTVGIAIRGSDKCNKESTCLPFPRYMELVSDVVYPTLSVKQEQETRPRLIMTTEDPNIFNASLAFQHNTSFPFQFLVNDQDNMQGSGFPKDFRDQGENTIVSTMTALQLHLSAGHVYLNCCSNFHAVIRNLFQAQCGAVRHGNTFVNNDTSIRDSLTQPTPKVARCLSNPNAVPRRYQICCGWYDKEDTVCNEIWTEHFQNRPDLAAKFQKKKK